MLLQKLTELSERMEGLAPPMYALSPVRWVIPLNQDGELTGGLVATAGENPRGKRMLVPHVGRTSGVRAKLLADTGEYVLGIPRDVKKTKRVAKCHAAFVEEVERCAEATGEPAVAAAREFLRRLDRDALELPEDFQPGDVLTFRVGETFPVDLPAVRRYWAAVTAETDGDAVEMECLVCGEVKPVEQSLPFNIKGVPGGQSSGMALVSANARAFESYGLKRSHISPVCRDCGEAFAKAAQELVRRPEGHLRSGPTLYLFWTRDDRRVDFVSYLTDPQPEEVQALLSAAWRGRKEALDVDAEPFYAVALTASGGRVVVRDWMATTVPRARTSLARYFRLQHITDPDRPDAPQPLKLIALAGATVRDLRDLPARVLQELLRVALTGGSLPDDLLVDAVRRTRADQYVTRPRAALIKMVLLSQKPEDEEETMVELDQENRQPAYLCGRLFAVLEDVQKAAIPGAKSTLVDRFFGSASAAPASVFGTLLRNAQAHLGKLRKEKRGAYEALERRLEEVMPPAPLPRTLNMRQQGLFSLGYYHQRAQTRAEIVARREAKQAAADSAAEDDN